MNTMPPLLAQTALLKTGMGEVLAIIMAFGFLYGVVKIISGAVSARGGGGEEAKHSIIQGVIIAGSVAIVTALFAAFNVTSTVTIGSW